MLKVIFFAPHAALWVHAFPEALVAETLAQSGHEVVYVTCGTAFRKYCIPISAAGVPFGASDERKAEVCQRCTRSKNLLKRHFGFAGYDFETRLEVSDNVAIDAIIASTTRLNYLDIKIEGVPVGRYALYELLLNHKKQQLLFSDAEWGEYLQTLENSLKAIFSAKRIFAQEKPDRIVSYNSLYSVNHVVSALAERYGIPSYFLHAGGHLVRRLETLLIGRKDGVQFYSHLLNYWPTVKNDSCAPNLLASVTDHVLELLRGKSGLVYSAPRANNAAELRGRWGIRREVKILVATMSSPDERFAAETIGVMAGSRARLFGTQIAWIKKLLEYVAARPNLFLILRVHPREFPNKREVVKSEHATMLQAELSHLPENAVVNWPEDRVSLYDLADVADVFLNAWSAAGKEMSLLGLPVVAYAGDLLAYPADLNYVASSEADYFEKIALALQEGWSIERLRMAYRWCALEYERATFDIAASFPQKAKTVPLRDWFYKFLRRINYHFPQHFDCLLKARVLKDRQAINDTFVLALDTPLVLLAASNVTTPNDAETQALRSEVGRLLEGLYGKAIVADEASMVRNKLSSFANGG